MHHPASALRRTNKHGAFSLVEVIVVSALITLVFGGLFAGVRFAVELVGHSKAEAGARSLAVAKIEYIRSLPYDDVGTEGGIPEGAIPQTGSTTINGIAYDERVLVQYLDRPEDGFGVDDENGVPEDSKVVKVSYTWNLRGTERTFTLTTDVIPTGIESTSGGGTLFIHVFDAVAAPVSGASVRVFNDTGTSTIDVTVTTNANGIANFPGAPARAGYQITATKDGFSTDQTYSASAENPNPNPPHVSVLEGVVSTVNFEIDELADLTLRAVSPPVTGEFIDTFDNTDGLAEMSGTAVSGGDLVLSGGAGTYGSSGTSYAQTAAPSALDAWQSFDVAGTAPANTSYSVHLYAVTGSGTSTEYTLVPDADLPGNSTGFQTGPVDLSSLDAGAYPALALGAALASSDANETPAIQSWEIIHVESEQPIADVTFAVQGEKSIGENGGSAVPKFETTTTTNGAGSAPLEDIESDVYTVSLNGSVEGYDIIEVRGLLPYVLDPGVSQELTLVLDTHTTHSLHLTVVDTTGTPVPNATVELASGAYDETLETSMYGQVHFGDIAAGSAYTLTVNADGYELYDENTIAISGTTELRVVLSGLE